MNPSHLLLVMLGGALGAGLRYWLGASMLQRFGDGLPWGTLAANVGGSFIAGGLIAVLADRGSGAESLRLLLVVGLLGGFTTYSALMLEVLALGRAATPSRAFLYLGLTLALGLAAVWAGQRVGLMARGLLPS